MDESPEPTVIMKTLKDFNQFIASGKRARESCFGLAQSSRQRLNFSDAASDTSSIVGDSGMETLNSRKRPLDALTGLDVCKRFRDKDVELVDARASITMLNGRLQNVETAHKKALVEAEKELENYKRKQMRDKELIDDLQHKIKQLQSVQQESKEEARKVKQKCNATTYETESRMMSMQREHIELNNRLQEEVVMLQRRVLELETDLQEKIIEVENVQCHADELTHQLDTAEEKVREFAAKQPQVEMVELQLKQAQGKIKDLELQLEEFSDSEKKFKIFEATVSKMHNLQKENCKLKEENKFLKDTAMNTKLMEEKLINAKQQTMLLEARCEDVSNIQAKADMYKNNLKQYEEMFMEELSLSQKPSLLELRSHISKLRREDRELTDSVKELCASQRDLENSRLSADKENKVLNAKIEKQQVVIQQNTQIIKRLQRKLLLLTQERDSLKNIISTYEAELTINFSTVSQERIEKMEKNLETYREELKMMEEELEECYKCAREGTAPTQQRKRGERVLSMEKRVKDLEEEVTKLTEANEALEGRIESLNMKGDYDPATTKVLHFKNNPLAEAVESRETEIETVQKENSALRERIRLLMEGEQHDLTLKVGMKVAGEGPSNKDILNLQEQISSMETRNKRLMEAFKKKSQEMREAIYLLTGYRVDSPSDNHYKLINMYAESPEDFLMFELTADGQLQLLETAFSTTQDELIEIYLTSKHSFPAFLSAITLDLFGRQSMASPYSGNEEEMEGEEMEELEDEVINRARMAAVAQRNDMHDDVEEEEEMEEEDEEEELEEEEEENEGGEEEEEDDDGDLICLD